MRTKLTIPAKHDEIIRTIDSNVEIISRIKYDFKTFNSVVQIDKDGNKLNPIQLKGVEGSDSKNIGAKLAEINENARTKGESLPIGSLYGFEIFVQTESSSKDLFDLHQNRFFIEGEGRIKYSYNNGNIANDPKLATLNFLNALEKMPTLIETYETSTAKISNDLTVLSEVVNDVWKKEDELKELKNEFINLDRQIKASLEAKEEEKRLQLEKEQAQSAETSENVAENIKQANYSSMDNRIFVVTAPPLTEEKTEEVKSAFKL